MVSDALVCLDVYQLRVDFLSGLGEFSFMQTGSSTSTMLLGYYYKKVESDKR